MDSQISLKDAIYRLQLSLLDGICHEDQLFAAGTLLSRRDYEDVVTERTITNLCGYPLCNNSLPSDRPKKGRYHISLKEHKVYDLKETFLYCSPRCNVNSQAFMCSLQNERFVITDYEKISVVLSLFNNLNLDQKNDSGKKDSLGSDIKIHEKLDVIAEEISSEDWIGHSHAIEGYVPQIDRGSLLLHSQDHGKGCTDAKATREKGMTGKETNFTSTIIVGDHSNLHKASLSRKNNCSDVKAENSLEKGTSGKETNFMSTIIVGDQSNFQKASSSRKNNYSDPRAENLQGELHVQSKSKLNQTKLKSSFKSSTAKTLTRSVTWSDEQKTEIAVSENVSDLKVIETQSESTSNLDTSKVEDLEDQLRFSSAEACAVALSEAAEAVASGKSDIDDAVSDAGIIILPPGKAADEGQPQKVADIPEMDHAGIKWPNQPSFLQSEVFDAEDSWFDSPPEGFSLTLSSFSTMWMALFGWVTNSSLAYIYGRDESAADEFLLVNGREYVRKIVLADGRSSEIRHTLDGCIARALPELATKLGLQTPISTLERAIVVNTKEIKTMVTVKFLLSGTLTFVSFCIKVGLLDTLSYTDALPPFRMKQWHVIVLVFLDALSVHKIPSLAPYMTSRKMLLHKVLDTAQIGAEEYESMKDLFIPLGRLPQFSVQCGG